MYKAIGLALFQGACLFEMIQKIDQKKISPEQESFGKVLATNRHCNEGTSFYSIFECRYFGDQYKKDREKSLKMHWTFNRLTPEQRIIERMKYDANYVKNHDEVPKGPGRS